jgi:peroxiredoxin-like protein
MPELHSTYPVSIAWTQGKEGVASAAGLPDLPLGSPTQFGGAGGQWTPEHLFVSAASACWMTTFLAIAELSKLEVVDVTLAGEGFLERGEGRRFSIPRITLAPRVVIRREEDREKAHRLILKAEEACLIARSMRSEITLESEVEIAQTV